MDILTTEIDIAISREDIDDIMVTALEGGINYWCDEASVPPGDRYLGEYASEQISRGGELWLHDAEEDEGGMRAYRKLNKEKFLEGLRRYIDAGNTDCIFQREAQSRNDPAAGTFGVDTGRIDADEADSIIQYALFGDLVYA